MKYENDITSIWEELACHGGRIIYLVLDGAGGLRNATTGKTALEIAKTPNLDKITENSSCGQLELVGPGITPGSGPGHLALFGYDPVRFRLGRGVLSALGIGFDLKEGDVASRINFANIDNNGNITDRRAGRISTEYNKRLCEKVRQKINLDFDGEFFLETVSEHRAVLILRGKDLSSDIQDTDPQCIGSPPNDPNPKSQSAKSIETANTVKQFIKQTQQILRTEKSANTILLRGFDRYRNIPTLHDRFQLNCMCIANYPMYRGLSRLLGMKVLPIPKDLTAAFHLLKENYSNKHNLYFLHVKGTDTSGEDGDFDHKVSVIEKVDSLLPDLMELKPDVLVVTADHSTPASMAAHSWHPVPVLIHSAIARADNIGHFDEYSCRVGGLGLRPGVHLVGLALAHAGRLKKFGA